MESGKQDEAQGPSLLGVLGSVLASMFGVQSSRKREEDFTHGKPSQYVIIGLLVTVALYAGSLGCCQSCNEGGRRLNQSDCIFSFCS